MNLYNVLIAKAMNGGGGGSSVDVEALSVTENGTYTAPSGKAYSPVTANVKTNATGSFTPASNELNISIETGLSSINGMTIYPLSSTYESGDTKYIHGIILVPNSSYYKMFLAYTDNNGGSKEFVQWVSGTPPITISGGTVQFALTYHYFKSGVTYSWEAW